MRDGTIDTGSIHLLATKTAAATAPSVNVSPSVRVSHSAMVSNDRNARSAGTVPRAFLNLSFFPFLIPLFGTMADSLEDDYIADGTLAYSDGDQSDFDVEPASEIVATTSSDTAQAKKRKRRQMEKERKAKVFEFIVGCHTFSTVYRNENLPRRRTASGLRHMCPSRLVRCLLSTKLLRTHRQRHSAQPQH